jgi:Rrf2 family protein
VTGAAPRYLSPMAANSRLASATHVLLQLAQAAPSRLSSARLAESVNTHPVLVRKLLLQLKAAGLVRSEPGRAGGVTLAKGPAQITLADVRAAVDDGGVFAFNPAPPNRHCPLSRRMKGTLEPLFGRVEASVDRELKRVRLSALLEG